MNFTPAKTIVSLALSAAIVLGIGASVVSSANESDARVTTTTTVSESTKLATPAGASKPVEKAEFSQVDSTGYKNRHISTPKVTPSTTAGPTATTTPGMPAEPVEQQKNLETNIEAGEHLNGTDYDLPSRVAEYETPTSPLG